MSFMAWNDRLIVGIKAIDDDHRKLVRLINELFDGIEEGRGRETLEEILDSLVNYTQYHFAKEEALLFDAGMPTASAHKKLHDDMVAVVLRAQQEYKRSGVGSPSLEMMVILKDWLFDHIMGADQRDFQGLEQKEIRRPVHIVLT
jgi:hemerythrin-like metal-binding protein